MRIGIFSNVNKQQQSAKQNKQANPAFGSFVVKDTDIGRKFMSMLDLTAVRDKVFGGFTPTHPWSKYLSIEGVSKISNSHFDKVQLHSNIGLTTKEVKELMATIDENSFSKEAQQHLNDAWMNWEEFKDTAGKEFLDKLTGFIKNADDVTEEQYKKVSDASANLKKEILGE